MTLALHTQHQLFEPDTHALRHKGDWHKQILESLGVESGPAWPDRFGKALREWLKKSGHKPIRTLSLFSGGGGLDIAFHDAGFEVLEMVEIDQRFAATLENNAQPNKALGKGNVRCIDIRDYIPPDDMQVDFIIGGPPCQTFSAAGRRASGVNGTDDPRGTLFEEYVRILKKLKPRGFLFENVYGIVGAQGGEAWRQIQLAFRDAGYTIQSRVLDAADYGTPQHRERLIIVGLRQGNESYHFPYPTHGPDAYTPRPFYTAGEAVQGADPNDTSSLNINGRWGGLIAGIPAGLNYSFYTKEMGHPSPVFAWRSKFSDFMYKADPDAPVRTLKAQGGLYTGPFSWENRHFSVAETKRLQTFPDDYEIIGKRQVCIHQIGNSVPPQFGRMLAVSILNQVFGVELPFEMHYLHDAQQLGFRTRKRNLTAKYEAKAKSAIANLDEAPMGSSKTAFPIEDLLYLTDKFDLTESDKKGGLAVKLSYQKSGSSISIVGTTPETRNTDFSFAVQLSPSITWSVPLESATLIGHSENLKMFTALMKVFEQLVAKQYGIDDLVQLSGYYQYTPQLKVHLVISSSKTVPLEWQTLCSVVKGIGVANTIPISSFADLWAIEESEVITVLHTLRSIGYEVRNHNTNPQINKGEFLIPYAFPTLTPRSVQLRKSL